MSATDPTANQELVVAEDGSIPADRVARLGLGPGAHLRVIETRQAEGEPGRLAGSLTDFPDLDWAVFERGRDLARTSAIRESRRRLARHRLVPPGLARRSETAAAALAEAERTDGIVVSVATLVDVWYVS